MKKQKLSLDQLKLKSFVTTDQKPLKGGLVEVTFDWQFDCGPATDDGVVCNTVDFFQCQTVGAPYCG